MKNKKGVATNTSNKNNLTSNIIKTNRISQQIKSTKSKKRKYRRKHNLGHIKLNYSYTSQELCKFLEISRSTYLNWKKKGLKVNGNLIFGADLKEFCKKEQNKRKFKCSSPNECSCLKCYKPVIPWENIVDLIIYNKKLGNIKGLCPLCGSVVNRIFSVRKINEVKKLFNVQTIVNERLILYRLPSGNCDLNEQGRK